MDKNGLVIALPFQPPSKLPADTPRIIYLLINMVTSGFPKYSHLHRHNLQPLQPLLTLRQGLNYNIDTQE
ncbi:hypothetical protein DSUL_140035 [Desulfovibrionales bacterium]